MKKAWFWIVVVLSAAAIASSAALFVDYVRGPVFCEDAGSGCAALRHTAWGHPFGLPMPVFGLSGFLAVALTACIPGRRPQIAQAVLASIGGAVALVLIGVQLTSKTICPYCMVTDNSALVVMGVSIARAVKSWDPPAARGQVFGGVGATTAAVILPLAIGFSRTPAPPPAVTTELPAPIREEIAKTPKGKLTIVDFIDFECPFCRATHKELEPLLAEYKDRIRLVRKQVPLRMHPHAVDAARAACCGELLGKGDEMADALVATNPDDLTPEGCEKLAEKLGLDADRFRACVKDPATDARIKADSEMFRASAGHGLPMLYIGETRLVGEQSQEELKATIDDELRRR